MWSDAVVDLSPVLGQDGHILQRVEDLAIQQRVAETVDPFAEPSNLKCARAEFLGYRELEWG